MTVRELLRGLAPPLLTAAAKSLLARPTRYSGPFQSWTEARAATQGYADPKILERVRAATASVLRGEADHEQDGIAFHSPASATPVLSGLLLAAALDGGNLRVLDFGGSLGSHYLKWRRFFDHLHALRWDIVEQSGFVDAGRALFKDCGLPVHFHESVDGARVQRPNAVLLGSVLQYVERPLELLARMVELGAEVVIIDRTPFSGDGLPRILVQHVSPRIYPTSYPMHVLAQDEVARVLGTGYDRLLDFGGNDATVRVGDTRASFLGSIWLKRDANAR